MIHSAACLGAKEKKHTKVKVSNDVLLYPVGKIFAPFCTSDETVLRSFNIGC